MNTINLRYCNISTTLNISAIKDYYIWEAKKFPPCSGVYIIYGRNGEPLYVGEAQSIQERIAEHVEEGEKGKYKDVKESRKRNIERQKKGEEIIPDENQAWYKRYFYKVKFIECEPVERKMLEIYLINKLDTPFNMKDNMFYKKGYSVEYESKHLKELMYSVEDEDVLNPAEEDAKFIGIPTEEYVLYFFYERITSSTKGIIGEAMRFREFKGSSLERKLEEVLKSWGGENYEKDKSYFSKYLYNGLDSYADIENVFIISTQDDGKLNELIKIINSFHR